MTIPPVIPAQVDFETAIALTKELLMGYEAKAFDEAALISAIQQLAASSNGARGFFVTALTSDAEVLDPWLPAIAQGLSQSPDVVAGLLVKNLAMSTAMGITHCRQGNLNLATSSQRVARRSSELIALLDWPQLASDAQSLVASIDSQTGEYASFLQRWGYDAEQQAAIKAALAKAFPPAEAN
jgi:hypothetical protein